MSKTEEVGLSGDGEKVELKRSLNLFNGITIIVGCIIGSGIFVSPRGVHEGAGSIGFSLIIWLACGVFSAIGAYCYAELGTLIRKSGGDYAYIMDAFGPFVGFIRLWIETMVVRPCTATVVALTFAIYMLRPFYPNCDPPAGTVQMLAACALIFLTFINCYSMRMATLAQDFFAVAKVFALILIIITGIVLLCMGKTRNFERPFEGTSSDVGGICLSFFSGLFAYQGWNYLNFIVEELQNPKRNLPLAIAVSCGVCTVIYVMVNIAFYTVITPDEMLESDAVAVDFANKLYGPMAWTMPIFVACSTIGSANGVILTSSRLFYAGAREGHMPKFLTFINPNLLTPVPAVIFTGLLALVYLFLSDNVLTLINYVQIVYSIAIGVATLALMRLRFSMKDAPRPIKVNIIFPIIFFLGCLFLVLVPAITKPRQTAIGIGLMLTGIPVYFFFIWWESKPGFCSSCIDGFVNQLTRLTQKLFQVVGEDQEQKDL